MSFARVVRSMVSLVMVLGLAGAALAAEGKKAQTAQPAMDPEAMMKEWAKWAAPGEPHQMLAKMVGKWNAVTKMMMAPGTEPMESKASAEFTSVMGGRWIRLEFTGEFMGQTFHGLGYNGYDNFRKRFVQTWMDDMSTGTMTSYGTASKDGKSVTYFGLMDEPMTGEKDKKVKSATRWVDDDTFVYESWDHAKGNEWKALEITYTRMK